MKSMKKMLLGITAVIPFALNSCNSVITYERAKAWVNDHYTEISSNPWYAIATFTWDYHGTVGDKAMEEVQKLMGTKGEDGILSEFIPEFKGTVYFPGKDTPIGKKIIVYHPLSIPPLTGDTFEKFYQKNDTATFRINNNELSVTDTLKPTEEAYDKGTIVHVHNKYGFYRGIGFKIGRGFIDKDNIIKLKAIIDLTYEDN